MARKKTTEEFIKEANEVHKGKYIYADTKYENNYTKVKIICPKHGEFWITPNHHLRGVGCPQCAANSRRLYNLSKAEYCANKFKEEANKMHNNAYIYDKSKYINSKVKLCITCPIHGDFWMTPNNHLSQKQGCPECAKIKVSNLNKSKSITTDNFIKASINIHGTEYDYSKTKCVNMLTKVCIICKKHGEFWQTPQAHLRGQGCPQCKQSHIERQVSVFLSQNNIEYTPQWKNNIIGNKTVDFYLPDYNMAIECQGGQHFFSVEHFGGKEVFFQQIQRDEEKYQQLTSNGIQIIYYTNITNIPKEFTDKHEYLHSLDDVLDTIKKKSHQIDDEISSVAET